MRCSAAPVSNIYCWWSVLTVNGLTGDVISPCTAHGPFYFGIPNARHHQHLPTEALKDHFHWFGQEPSLLVVRQWGWRRRGAGPGNSCIDKSRDFSSSFSEEILMRPQQGPLFKYKWVKEGEGMARGGNRGEGKRGDRRDRRKSRRGRRKGGEGGERRGEENKEKEKKSGTLFADLHPNPSLNRFQHCTLEPDPSSRWISSFPVLSLNPTHWLCPQHGKPLGKRPLWEMRAFDKYLGDLT